MIVASICARAGSERLPGKALREIAGATLLKHAIGQAQTVREIERVAVSTDGQQIADEALRCGAEVLMRPAYLATARASKWDVFRHLVKNIPGIGLLVDLDIGCPLRSADDIRDCITKAAAEDYDVVCTAYEAERNPYFNMVEIRRGRAQVICKTDTIVANAQDAPPVYSLSPAVYAIKPEALWMYDHWSQSRLGIYVIPHERAWDVDTPLDLDIARFLMERQ